MADLSGLLDEISADSPCGENLEYDSARVALDTNIQGTPENQFTGEKAQPPNWRDIEKQAISLLQKSKDLQVVLYLIRAEANLGGIVGFRDGVDLLEHSLVNYWDSIHPRLDPDDGLDPTLRVNILEELNSFELVLRPLSLAMLVESKSLGRFCLRDIQYATDKVDVPAGVIKPEISVVRAAFLDVDAETLNASYRAIVDSIDSIQRIDDLINQKVGIGQGADLSQTKSLLKEIRAVVEQFAGERLAGEAAPAELEPDGEEASGSGVSAAARPQLAGAIQSRHEVLKALDMLCKYYAEYEPSSPVPILLRRAKYLATADFMDIIQNLVPDAISQIDAIKGPDLN
ncbi:type VI secretion system protein TssA [Methylomonas montana]|uniref:type VI secretion system protein TssA n=1 Tax=Methylomonas montana TaxID=3058963 RepID=UPI002657D87D|nr:type VI secretion system protein TssA [Methylomonas montana]WKJ90873.1 type VI secretion system protein TssA [Methylomonas montana]